MQSLTEYRKPQPRYGRAQIAASPWIARGGWRETEPGRYVRIYARRRSARGFRQARRAVCRRIAGEWRFEIEQFDLTTREVVRICVRSSRGWAFAQASFAYADLAAKTAD
jgi:hypothetical protein